MLSRIIRCRQITNRFLNTASVLFGDASKKKDAGAIGKQGKCQPCQPTQKKSIEKCKFEDDDEEVLIKNI